MFSGDKLLGGPQAGKVVGRSDLIRQLSSHPVARAMRIDGPSLAALAVTLDRYADGTASALPFWAMAAAADLEERASRILEASGADGRVRIGASTVGAGSVPGAEVPSPVIEIRGNTDRRYLALLAGDVPVIARREEGALVVDPRTVFLDQEEDLAAEIARACRS
jgi:L-seryl-tRNA(Ser) seleniumtransferase